MVTGERLREGAIYPSQLELRSVSLEIAVAVVREARTGGFGRGFRDEEIEPAVDGSMWFPEYLPYRPA